MQVDYNKKYLIIDKSGFDSFTFASARKKLDIWKNYHPHNFMDLTHIIYSSQIEQILLSNLFSPK